MPLLNGPRGTVNGSTLGSLVASSSAAQQAQEDEFFNNLAHQFDGTDYEAMARANEYLTSYNTRDGWDRFLESINLRSPYQRAESERKLNAAQRVADIEALKHKEEYDSPEQQAQRERAAGLNPDLTGNVSAGESGSLAEDAAPGTVAEDSSAVATGLISCIGQALSGALSLSSQVMNLQGLALDLDGKRLSNLSDLAPIAHQRFLDYAEDSDFFRFNGSTSSLNGTVEVVAPNHSSLRALGLSRRQIKAFDKLYEQEGNSLKTAAEYYGLRNKSAEERKKWFYNYKASKYYSDSDSKLLKYASQGVSALMDTKFYNDLEADAAESAVNKQYHQTAKLNDLGYVEADDELQTHAENARRRGINNDLYDGFGKWIHSIKEKADNGDEAAQRLLIAMATIPQLMQAVQNLPKPSRRK